MLEILITEDHPVVAEGLKKLFDSASATNKINIAVNGKQCRTYLDIYTPDIVLMDINLPDVSGIELTKEIKTRNAKIKVLALTTFNEYSYIRKMLDAGADGYILKNATPEEILEAVADVLEGKVFISPDVRQTIEKSNSAQILLTNREKEVLALIADGHTNTEIAEKLFISPLTVDSHRKNLILKLKAKNTASLVKAGFEMGLIS